MKTTGNLCAVIRIYALALLVIGLAVVSGVQAQDDVPLFSPEQDYFLDANVDNLSPFVGQQITYTLRFFAASVPEFSLQEPDFTGFWRGEQTTGRTIENVGGRQYTVTATSIVLFPTRSGRLTIDAAELTIPATVFSDPIRLRAPDFALNVRALPDGAPDGFNGAVGRFSLEVSVDRTTVTLGEPVALRYRVTGTGNFEQMPPPELNLPVGWRAYRDTDSGTLRMLAGGVLSEAVYEWQLIPDRAGSSDFPPFTLVYFDPLEASYNTAEAAPIRVDVLPSGDVREIPDLSTLGGATAALSLKSVQGPFNGLSNTGLAWWLWLIPPLIAFGVWGGLRWRRWQHGQMLLRKQENALERARKRLQAALDTNANQRPDLQRDIRVYGLVFDAVCVYLSDKFITTVGSIGEAQTLLESIEIDDALRESVLEVMRAAQDGRYAPQGIVDSSALLRRAAEMITQLDDALPDPVPVTGTPKGAGSGYGAPVVMLMTFILLTLFFSAGQSAAQESTQRMMTEAANAYAASDYQTAVRLYEGLIASGQGSLAVYYNLGSTYFELDNLGQAMLNFLRAYRIAPRDGDVNLALALVRALRVDIQGDETAFIDNVAVFTSGVIALSEFSWLAFGLWALWFSLLALWFWRPVLRERLRAWLFITGVLMLLMVGLYTARVYVEAARPAAVVTELRTRAMSGPGESYLELFDLYAAAEVRILEERGGWVRVLLPDGLQAWLQAGAVARV